jgi:hypothetical protein
MAKTRAKKTPQQTRAAQGVTKPTQRRGGSTLLKAAKKGNPNGTGRLDKERTGEEMEALLTEHMQAASKPKGDNSALAEAKKTGEKQEEPPMASTSANERNTAAVSGFSTERFPAINAPKLRKSRVDDAHQPSTNSSPATVIQVPRSQAKFVPKGRSENVGIILADLGNFTTITAWALGLDQPETFDCWKGAAAQRQKEVRTRAVARKQDDGEWHLEFGPDTNVVCEEEGRVVVFDNMKLSMNPASEHFKLRQEKEKMIGIENIYQRFIEWVFITLFTAAKLANSKIESFRVYTGLPADWPEQASFEYQQIIENIPGWEGIVDVNISSEPTAAIVGRLKSMKVEQRKDLGVYLKDPECAGVLDLGDATEVRQMMHTLFSCR